MMVELLGLEDVDDDDDDVVIIVRSLQAQNYSRTENQPTIYRHRKYMMGNNF